MNFCTHVILNNLLCFSINIYIYIKGIEVTVFYFTPGFSIAFQLIDFILTREPTKPLLDIIYVKMSPKHSLLGFVATRKYLFPVID